MKRRVLSLLLAIAMTAVLAPGFAAPAYGAETSGTCGDNATWVYDSTTGTLTISGTGAISDYDSPIIGQNKSPWAADRTNIKEIVIADGITAIGNYAFYQCTEITEVDIPLSVVSIGNHAFNSCSNLKYMSHNAAASLGTTALPTTFPGISGYKITFDDNDPTTPNRIVKAKSNTIQEPSSPKVGEDGFVGWYKDKELTVPISFPYTPAKTTEICYGKWADSVVELEGPFTVTPLNADDTIELRTDYFWENGILSITTDTPVVVGMKETGATTSDQIHIKGVNADVTLDNVNIEIPDTQVTDAALYIEKCSAVTLRIVGTTTINNLSMFGTTKYGYGIEIYTEDYAESEVTITGNGTLNIEASAWALTDSGETTSSVIFDTVTAEFKSYSSPWVEEMTIQNGARVKFEYNIGNSFGVIPPNDTALTIAPTDGKLYRIDSGASASDATSQYVMGKSDVVVYSHYYFYAEEIDTVPITEASASIDAPAKNGTPDTTADIPNGANYTVSAVTWNGDPAKFLGGTAYTATFTLTPNVRYVFVSDTAVTVDGAAIVGKTLNNDGSLTVSAKFPATEAAVPASIAVKIDPTDVEYTYGDEFDPTGLVITVTYDDDTTQDVAYDNGTKDDFSFAPTELTVATTQITVTYANKTAEISVTIAQKDINSAAVSAIADQTYTGEAITPGFAVEDGGITLTKDTDYTVEYRNNVNAGTAKVIVIGIGNYKGTVEMEFTINKAASPAAPTVTGSSRLEGLTYTYTVTEIAGAEYSMDGTSWQDSNVFANLTAGQSYTFYARLKETDNVMVGAEGRISVDLTKLDGSGTVAIESWHTGQYDAAKHGPSITDPNGVGYTVRYVGTGETVYDSGDVPTEPGSYKVVVNFNANALYNATAAEAAFTIVTPVVDVKMYWPELQTGRGGTVRVTPIAGAEGTEMTLVVTPEDGMELDTIRAYDAAGGQIPVFTLGSGRYSFTQPDSKVTVVTTFAENCISAEFSDLDLDAWYHEATDFVLERGLMIGTGNGRFEPDGTLDRAQVLTVLWRLEGSPANDSVHYSDVPEQEWYADAVAWATELGLALGHGDGTFGPADPVTLEQLAAFLHRYVQYKAGAITETSLEAAMAWAEAEGLLTGMEGVTTPDAPALRSQIAYMLMKVLER